MTLEEALNIKLKTNEIYKQVQDLIEFTKSLLKDDLQFDANHLLEEHAKDYAALKFCKEMIEQDLEVLEILKKYIYVHKEYNIYWMNNIAIGEHECKVIKEWLDRDINPEANNDDK